MVKLKIELDFESLKQTKSFMKDFENKYGGKFKEKSFKINEGEK